MSTRQDEDEGLTIEEEVIRAGQQRDSRESGTTDPNSSGSEVTDGWTDVVSEVSRLLGNEDDRLVDGSEEGAPEPNDSEHEGAIPDGLEHQAPELHGQEDKAPEPTDPVVDDRPLYAGAQISVTESVLAIFTLVIKHNLTGVCLIDLLLLINLHLIQENNLFRTSLFKLNKYFKKCSGKFGRHYFCSDCFKALPSENSRCSAACKSGIVSEFITLSIVDQLQEFFLRENFPKLLKYRFERLKRNNDNLEDLYDGKLYKKMQERGFFLNENDISFMWYSDGVPVFKSSKCSMWPLYLVVNELPYKERFLRENLILAGIWVGTGKPNANLFVKALTPELARLKAGVKFKFCSRQEDVSARGILLCGTCDLPAKSQFLNFLQFNGYFGCPCCEIKGERVQLPNDNYVHAYPYERDITTRTAKQTVRHSEIAVTNGKPEKGVKGPCVLSKLMPDFVMGMSIDSMHGVYSGVAKKLLQLWFDSSFSGESFSLSAVQSVVTERLLKMLPPNFVERLPRTLNDLCHWKATEFRTWLFYYSLIVLQDLMKRRYFRHYLSLVKAIALLNSDSVSSNHIITAKNLLHDFVKNFVELYGLRFCSINVHQLLHLPQCVENLGPLWVYACFRFEDINGHFLKLVHGTNYVSSQICSSQWYRLRMLRYAANVINDDVRDFVLGRKKRLKISSHIAENCYSLGATTRLNLIPDVILGLMDNLEADRRAWKYSRLFKEGIVYVSMAYGRCVKTDSSYILYSSNGGERCFGRVLYFYKLTDCQCTKKCYHVGSHYAYIKKIATADETFGEGDLAPTHLRNVCPFIYEEVVPIADITNLCFSLNYGDNAVSAIGELVDFKELE